MCGSSDVKCEIKITELGDGYQIQITGNKVKDTLKAEDLKKCIQACCFSEEPFKDICPR